MLLLFLLAATTTAAKHLLEEAELRLCRRDKRQENEGKRRKGGAHGERLMDAQNFEVA